MSLEWILKILGIIENKKKNNFHHIRCISAKNIKVSNGQSPYANYANIKGRKINGKNKVS